MQTPPPLELTCAGCHKPVATVADFDCHELCIECAEPDDDEDDDGYREPTAAELYRDERTWSA